jgi:hypothetical protein
MKVVLNNCFGGFSISREAAEFMAARGNELAKTELDESSIKCKWYGYGYTSDCSDGYSRTDPDLIAAVEILGDKANGRHAKLKVVEIPDNIEYDIESYDGAESIHEKHKSWV